MSMDYLIWEQNPCNSYKFLRAPVIGLYFQVSWGDAMGGIYSKPGWADDVPDWRTHRLIDSKKYRDIPVDGKATAKAQKESCGTLCIQTDTLCKQG